MIKKAIARQYSDKPLKISEIHHIIPREHNGSNASWNEVEARLYDQSDVKKLKELRYEVDRFDFEFVQEENLNPIIGYVQELDIKYEKCVKDYIIKYKLKNLENDFKKIILLLPQKGLD